MPRKAAASGRPHDTGAGPLAESEPRPASHAVLSLTAPQTDNDALTDGGIAKQTLWQGVKGARERLASAARTGPNQVRRERSSLS